MKHITLPTALCASLTLGFAAAPLAHAQVDEIVEEIAATPVDLTTLLGDAGLDGASCDFYLRMEVMGDTNVMHWKTEVEDDQIVFTMGQTGRGNGRSVERQMFDADGEFVESSSATESPDYNSTEIAVREGDKIRVVSSDSFAGDVPENTEEVLIYQPLEDAVPTSWLPIVFAYHFREGHDLFTIRMSEDVTGERRFIEILSCEDVGTEMIEVGDEEVEAHVLMVAMGTEIQGADEFQDAPGEQVARTMLMYVLADGSIVRMRMEMEGMTMDAEAITAQEAKALLEAAADDDVADGAADAAE